MISENIKYVGVNDHIIDLFEGQYHDFDKFINDIDMIVILTAHDEIKNNQHKLSGKVVFDTRLACTDINVYTL